MAIETKAPYFLELSLFSTIPMIVSVASTIGNLGGGVGLIPEDKPVRLAPGETGTYFVTIHNSQDRPLTVSFQTNIVAYPTKASGEDLMVTHQRVLTIRPGNNRVIVVVNARPNAASGTYIITNSVFL